MTNQVTDRISKDKPRLVLILGPTAAGKTSLAFGLACQFKSDLISIDSRQVYRNLDIVTGKDIPTDFKFDDKGINSFYTSPYGFRVYGISCCPADQSFSLALFLKALPGWCHQIKSRSRRIILVGGTIHWFYRLLSGKFDQAFIPVDANWRRQADNLGLEEIQKLIINKVGKQPDFINHDDWLNKQRLIRWYERLSNLSSAKTKLVNQINKYIQVRRLVIVKEPEPEILKDNIKQRIKSRLSDGAIDETKFLLSKYGRQISGLASPGYRQIVAYLDNQLSYQAMIDEWFRAELDLVKRQKVWLKKIKQVFPAEILLV